MSFILLPSLERSVRFWQRAIVEPMVRLLPPWLTADALSLGRLALAAGVAALLVRNRPGWALALYLLALVTDTLDGGVARLRRQETPFGARLDPTIDKALHGILFVVFFPAFPELLGALLALDALLLALGFLVVLRHHEVSASSFGKWKLSLQAAGCLALFWNRLIPALALPSPAVTAVLGAALVLATLSALDYAERFALS